jgi:hypothetical protein
MSPAVRPITSLRLRPVRMKVRSSARSLRPVTVSGTTASNRRTSSAAYPRAVIAAIGVLPALLQSRAARDAAEASRATADIEIVNDLVYGSWTQIRFGQDGKVEIAGRKVGSIREGRRAELDNLQLTVKTAPPDQQDQARTRWWATWESKSRYTGSRGPHQAENKLARGIADELEVLGLACMAGLAPLSVVLAGQANNAVLDWALCEAWVRTYREAATFRKPAPSASGRAPAGSVHQIDWQRRHAEWIGLVGLRWLQMNGWKGEVLDLLAPDLVDMRSADLVWRIRVLTLADEFVVSAATWRQIEILLRAPRRRWPIPHRSI